MALRERALVFDPILPPIHPRIGAPKQYPIASRLQTQRLDAADEEDAGVSSAAKRRKAKVDAAQDEDDAGLRRDKDD